MYQILLPHDKLWYQFVFTTCSFFKGSHNWKYLIIPALCIIPGIVQFEWRRFRRLFWVYTRVCLYVMCDMKCVFLFLHLSFGRAALRRPLISLSPPASCVLCCSACSMCAIFSCGFFYVVFCVNHGVLGAAYVVDVDMVFQIDATTVHQCGISSLWSS